MNKLMMAILCLGVIFIVGCGTGGKYGDVKQLMTDYINMTNKLDKALAGSNDGKAVAKALNEYIAQMKEISPKLESMPEKYPELEDNPPAELQELMDKFEASTDSFENVFQKLMEYSQDPDVQQAMEQLMEM